MDTAAVELEEFLSRSVCQLVTSVGWPPRPTPSPGPAARGAGGHGGWTPLRCAVAGAANPLITRLLLERGAVPGDHDLYLAGSADDNHECLRLLLTTTTDTSITAATPRA
jgi:hypothetical protein